MAIGLSTYAFFWRGSTCVTSPASLMQMLEETAELGGTVFQICDYPAIESLEKTRLKAFAQRAEALGVTLELGTRGLSIEHLLRYVELAERLGAGLLRSMYYSGEDRPDEAEAVRRLETVLPQLEQRGVTLALETYEQVALEDLMRVIDAFESDRLGVCLDPANCVAALEMPERVIERTASRVVNLHVKDFDFSRSPGWVGFQLSGAPLGEGLLPLDDMMARVRPQERDINCIIEHWLPWQCDEATTCNTEARWTRHCMDVLRSRHG